MKWLLLLVLVGCKPIVYPNAKSYGVKADFSIYINKFNSELAMDGYRNVDLSYITFYRASESIDHMYDGICSKGADGYKVSVVTDDVTVFDYRTYFIVIHELGHCSYNLNHIAGPGIMNSNNNIGLDFSVLENRLKLINQMLNGGI